MESDVENLDIDKLSSDFDGYIDSITQNIDPKLRVNEIDLNIHKKKGLKRKCVIFSVNNTNYIGKKDGAFLVYTFMEKNGLHCNDDIETCLTSYLDTTLSRKERNEEDLNIFNIAKLKSFLNILYSRIVKSANIDFYKAIMNEEENNMFQAVSVTADKNKLSSVQPYSSNWNSKITDEAVGNNYNDDEYQTIQTSSMELNYPDNVNHASARPFICHYKMCNRAFKRFEHLKRHYRIHTGERPFKCKFPGCHKAFARSDNLNQHLRIHSSESQISHHKVDVRNLRYHDDKD